MKMKKIKMNRGEIVFQAFNYTFMLLLCFATLYPFWYVFILSLNSAGDTALGGIYFWPRKITFSNYSVMFAEGTIFSAFFISFLRILIGVPLHLIVTSVTAYALSRSEFIMRKFFTTFFFITFLFGGGLIPYFLLLNDLRLLDTFWVYILPGVFGVWNFIVFKTFFKNTIPESLIESALIDGARHITIVSKIVFPLALPCFATLGLFASVGAWNDWFAGAYFVRNPNLLPIQTYLQRIIRGAEQVRLRGMVEESLQGSEIATMSPQSLTMSAIIIGIIPILFVYPWLQNYFVQGMRVGSIKE